MNRLHLPLLLLAVLLSSAACRGQISREPPVHLVWNMDFQKKFTAQEKNAFYPDQRAMRPPVAGTVAQGELHEDVLLTTGRNPDGSYSATLPPQIVLDDKLLAHGRERFNIFCAPCHDQTGSGKGIVVQRGFMPPPDFHSERIRGLPIGQIYEAMAKGVRTMPSYAAQVPVQDRWAVAAYVRALQLSRNADANDVPADIRSQKGW